MFSQDQLDILACPTCKGELHQDATRQLLLCQRCALAYPVRRGIPVLMHDEALPLDEQSGCSDCRHTGSDSR